MNNDGWEIIHRYTRRQAIADGVLIDVSGMASQRGFKVPVAITREAWVDCVAWTTADTNRTGVPQDQEGRLWDVLIMAGLACRFAGTEARRSFVIMRVPRDGRAAVEVELHVHIGPGDNAEPVITIMQPTED